MDENIGFYQKRRQSADQEIAAFMEKYRQYAVSYCYLCCRYSGFRSWADMGRHEEKNDRGRKLLLNVVGLDNHLISELTSLTTQTTNIVLTDPPGSVIATFSATAGSAALSGNKALASVDGPDLYIATSQEQLIEILDYLGDAP